MNEKQKERLLQIIDESNNIVFFGGAGVSTASGIPDFRSKNGLYNQKDIQFEKYSPEYLLSRSCLYDNPKVFFEFYRQKLDTRGIEPNIAHATLAKMEEMGKLKAVITQNIDGLHQLAGSKEVYEIHGTTQRNYCIECGKEYPADYIFECEQYIPRCDCKWNGIIRPEITLYEEGLPNEAVANSIQAIIKADTLIIAGTSLNVYPAASYISYFGGKYLIILNMERSEKMFAIEQRFKKDFGTETLFIQGDMSEAFVAILRHISEVK